MAPTFAHCIGERFDYIDDDRRLWELEDDGNADEFAIEPFDTIRDLRAIKLKTINVAILYDSKFCQLASRDLPSHREARARIQSIVNNASEKFRKPKLAKIQLAYVDGFCDPATDPFRTGQNQNLVFDMLEKVERYWEEKYLGGDSTLSDALEKAGVALIANTHLFSGVPFKDNKWGAANRNKLCSPDDGYGVDYVWYRDRTGSTTGLSDNNRRKKREILTQGLIFAHEMARKYQWFPGSTIDDGSPVLLF